MMKKIILLFLGLFLSFSAFAQFPNPGIEGFENTTGPDTPGNVPSAWTLGTGVPGNQWAVFSQGSGNGRWNIFNQATTPPTVCEGSNTAHMNRVQQGPNGVHQSFLATPRINVPNNGQLRFLARTFILGNQGTFYDIKIAPGTSNQMDPASYTTTLATFTEDQLSFDDITGVQNDFTICTRKVLNFPANLYGQQVYVAFVRRHTQGNSTTVDGDRFLVDAVQLNERCLDPTTLATGIINASSAELTWANPSGATTWQIEIVNSSDPFTGNNTILYSGALPYLATTTTGANGAPLVSLDCYKFRVKAICSGTPTAGITSDWSATGNFCTTQAPPVCGGNYLDPGGTANYPNNANSTLTVVPTNPGDLVTVTFTSFATQAGADILSIYDGASAIPSALLGTFSGTAIPPSFTSSAANGSLTFVFVSNATTTAAGWVANITCAPPPPCQRPTSVVTVPFTNPAGPAVTHNSINFGWTPVGAATSFEYVILPCTAGAPTAASTGTPLTSNPFNITTGVLANTCYRIYVRGICPGIGTSDWSTPLTVTTPIAPPVCGGNFVDSGGPTAAYGANENNTVTICPTVAGQEVTVTFSSFNTEATWDGLYVYASNTANPANQILSGNGPGNAAGPLTQPGAFWGATIPGPFTGIAANGGCLTFVFLSDGTTQNPGWVSSITCAPPPTCPKPINLAVIGNPAHNSVSLNWTNVGPATAWQVLALPCTAPAPTSTSPITGWVDVTTQPTATNPFVLTGLTPSTCYNIYVRGNCGPNDLSIWTGPVSITTPIAPPVCGGQFYDPSGPNANYANNLNSTVTICPTLPGEVVTVTFTAFAVEANNDGMYVYDGNGVAPGTQIPSNNPVGTGNLNIPGAYWGNNTLPGPFTSTAANGCLTFVFISNGNTAAAGWVANITCSPAPTCSKPTALTATAITQTSATLSWTQPLNPNGGQAGAWEVFVLPAGSPIPTTAGIPVSTTTYIAQGLAPGRSYVFYVRAICSPTDASTWAALPFATKPINDECANATFAIVNQNLNCIQTTPGSLNGASASLPAPGCPGTADDDVWFTFTATAATHVISFNNVSAPAPTFNYAIYQGTCTGLTQVGTCNSGAGLTANTTYYLRVYSATAVPQNTTFNLCIGTLPCTEAPAFCTGQTVTYANATNVPSLGAIGCLATSPNPAFFFLQVNQAGPLSYLISQVDTTGTPRDVDYVAWGPFTSLNAACNGVPANPLPGLIPALTPAQGCSGNLHACSYSIAPTEIMCIPNAQLCQVYVIMITNFSNAAGTVTFTQTNTGGGTTECFPINTFNYPQTNYCQNGTDPTPVLAPGAAAGTYTASPAGLSINPTTGVIDLSASLPGPYIVTSTTLTSTGGACTNIPSITTSRTVIITAPASATISYANSPYCKALTAPQPATVTGTAGGTFSATPAGLLLDVNTGDILPVSSQPGIYTVTYSIPAVGGCAAFTTTAQVEIIPSVLPTFTQVQPICPGGALAALPTTSLNGVVGTWSPAINNTATTTYTFTPNPTPGSCISSTIMTIIVGSTTPTFAQVPQICAGTTLAPLPTTSLNGVTGTWSPAIDNMATTTYTFTPTPGVCATPVTMTISVNPPIGVSVNSSTICAGGTATVTATPTLPGTYTYTWTVPTGVTNPGNVASFTTTVAGNYTVVISQNNTFCNNDFENPVGVPAGGMSFVNQTSFPCWGTTATDGMIEVWSNGNENTFAYSGTQFVELNANQVSTLFQNITVIPGTSVTVAFAHRGRFSGTDVMRVEIGPVAGPFVSLGNFSATPSNWVYNTVPYTFPNNGVTNYRLRFVSVSSGSGQLTVGNFIDAVSVTGIGCPSLPTTGTVNFTNAITPTFNIASICQGTTPPALPTSSNDTPPITGTWSPATIDTSVVGTFPYVFTPTVGQCVAPVTVNITITPASVTPVFNTIPALCQGDTPPVLATTSNNTVTGTWSPAVINTNITGPTRYDFTPAAGQCALPTFITVVVNARITPTFNQIGPLCQNSAAPALPTSSTNAPAITGTWSPATINTAVVGQTTYTFTPATGSCANIQTMVVDIIQVPVIAPIGTAYGCESYTLPTLSSGGYYSQPNGQGPITNMVLTTNQTVYVYEQAATVTVPPCFAQQSFNVVITQEPEFDIQAGCQGNNYVLQLINTNFDMGTATYTWNGPNGVITNNSPSLVITTPGTYTVGVSIANGQAGNFCTNSDTHFANEANCNIPKGISPNGDSLNDTLDLSGFNVGKLAIFNRYGKAVYTKFDYKDEWFGQSDSGNELPDGTYYYVIEGKTGGDTLTGWIYINREIR